jgi:3-oxoacyl-[acyl-carrier protein] reductase
MQRSSIITGASSGIGQAIASAFAREGFNVLGMQRRKPGIAVDFHNLDEITPAWASAMECLGEPPEILVLNAGNSMGGAFEQTVPEDLLRLTRLLFIAPMLLAREAISSWKAASLPGHIVFIGSQAGLPGASQPFNAAYSACKAGIHGIVGPLAAEFGPKIRVNAVAPGDVLTPLAERSIAQRAARTGASIEELQKGVASLAALKRWVEPSEIAEAVLFLHRCAAMTGAVINVSAGRSIH